MPKVIASQTPTSIQAGDSVNWDVSLDDYPASDGWVLSYVLHSPSHTINLTSVASDDAHLFAKSSNDTQSWQAGDYSWAAYVVKDAVRYTLEQGRLVIKPDLAAIDTGYDTRSAAEKCLAAIDDALATKGAKLAYTQEYSIGDRRIRFNTTVEMMDFRARLRQEIAQEKAITAKGSRLGFGKVRVRF